MHNKPHSEDAKAKISAALKAKWASLTDEQRKQRGKKLSDFYANINDKERERQAKEWERLHAEYIKDEYQRIFGTYNL